MKKKSIFYIVLESKTIIALQFNQQAKFFFSYKYIFINLIHNYTDSNQMNM